MDIIKKAQARLAELDVERDKLKQFLATAQELGATVNETVVIGDKVEAEVIRAPRRRLNRERKPPTSGAIYDTAMAIISHMTQHGEGKTTRELVPVIEAAGIEIGGNNPVATLSARIGTSQMFERRDGKLFIRSKPDKEAAGSATNETPADFDLLTGRG